MMLKLNCLELALVVGCYLSGPLQAGVLNQDISARKDGPSKPNKQYPEMAYRPFEYRSTSDRTPSLGVSGQEASVQIQSCDPSGVLYTFGEELHKASVWPLKLLGKPIPIPAKERWDARFQMKFRNGAWFARTRTEVRRLDPKLNTWATVLKTDRNFSQFEVTPDGGILLVGSGIPQAPPQKLSVAHMEPFGFSEEGSHQFISLYSEGAEKADKELDLPSDFKSVEKLVGDIGGPTESFWMGGNLILHAAYLGRIWCLDFNDWRLRELDVPWISLNQSLLEKNWKKVKNLKSKNSVVFIQSGHFPFEFRFFPSSTDALQIVVKWMPVTIQMKTEQLKNMAALPWAGDVIDLELRDERTELYELDLAEFKIRKRPSQDYEVQKIKEMKGPYWLRFDATPLPLPVYTPPKAEVEEVPPVRAIPSVTKTP